MNSERKFFSLRRIVKLFFVLGIPIYLAFCIGMDLGQRWFIYYPQVYNAGEVDEMARTAGLERWTNSSGMKMGLERPSPHQPALGNVLVTYGNGSTAISSAHYADEIQRAAAVNVYLLEYPGYEDRPGRPTEKNLFQAAREALDALPANQPLYLVGESLGTGVASYLAGTYPERISGILLISPFTSVRDVAQQRYPILPVSLLLKDRFNSECYLKQYHGKVGIVVDGRDDIVPAEFGRKLYNGYAGPKKLWEFPDGAHCQIGEDKTIFWKDVIAYWLNSKKT